MKRRFRAIIIIIVILIAVIISMGIARVKKEKNIDPDIYFSQLENKNSNNDEEILKDINYNLENPKIVGYERGLNLLGVLKYNYKLGNITLVLEKFGEVENYLQKNNMPNELLKLYEIICEHYTSIEKYDKVYRYIYKGEIIAADLYEKKRTAENLSELLAIRYLKAIVAMELGMEAEADSAFLKAQRIEDKNLVSKRADINYNKLIYYFKKSNYEKAIEYSDKVLKIINYKENDIEYLDIYLNTNIMLAESYLKENKIDECNYILEKIEESNVELKVSIRSKLYILKSKIAIYNNEMDNAAIYLEKAYYEIVDYDLSIREMKIIDKLVMIYEEINYTDKILIWSKKLRKTLNEIENVSEYQELFSSIINTDLLEANHNVELLELKSKNLKYLILIIILIIIFITRKIFNTIKKKNLKNKILNDNLNLLNKQLIYQYNHYESIKEHQLVIRRIWHDIKNHYIVLCGLMDSKKYKEAKLYLESLNKEFIPNKIQNISKNNIIDAIFSNKIKLCKERNIDIELDIRIPEKLNIDNFDLCAIFGNLLDNSIEACERICDKNIEKYIKVKSFIKNQYLYIEIENSCVEEVQKSNDKFITSKKDKFLHGLGIDSIDISVKKYGGITKIVNEDKKFLVRILLKNQIV